MGLKYQIWQSRNPQSPESLIDLETILFRNRSFSPVDQLDFGDHGLQDAMEAVIKAVEENKRIALYADYDVDGTMSCVSWVWFFQAIGFSNFTYYIPDRFKEGYGLNLPAIKRLVQDEGAEVVITMDTGITANTEAQWCKENGVEFICTDHHVIQPDKMPDCIILNPKNHPDPTYQELCGCGITFVLLRKLGSKFNLQPSDWNDLLALAGIATICDLVPLNGVNHKLARLGIQALVRSHRPIFQALKAACAGEDQAIDEMSVGFMVGPRINAVGRLYHALTVVDAFVGDDPEVLVHYMDKCNEERKAIQKKIVDQAMEQAAAQGDAAVLFLGHEDWHEGVVGIAASKIAEEFWRPVFLFKRGEDICKGSARSIPNFDVTSLMMDVNEHFYKFGGHPAAGGFSFKKEQEEDLKAAILAVANNIKQSKPECWDSLLKYDCVLPVHLLNNDLLDCLDKMKPYGHGYELPSFRIKARLNRVQYYNDKQTSKPKHTCFHIDTPQGTKKLVFFNKVFDQIREGENLECLAEVHRNNWRGRTSVQLIGRDLQ